MENKRVSLKSLLDENDYVGNVSSENVVEIPLDKIKPNPYQPRHTFDDKKIVELAESIKEHGVFQPIVVKHVGEDYVIISGERRFRASVRAGLQTIPAIVRDYEKSKMVELAIVENLQREDLTPVEEALGYQALMNELSVNQTELAKKVGKSRSYVTNVLGILSLPEDVLALCDKGKLSMGHARALSKLKDSERITSLARDIVEKGLSVREVEDLLKAEPKKNSVKRKTHKRLTEYKSYERAFRMTYKGSRMKVNDGRITITLDNNDDIQKIIDKLLK
ncbi:MAG: ParB/RepB/Spo0J family partition protein [Acholeplasmatales bacterium]|nr:ParB/RepB/Spo0J family partition protein [Acholeplasmatales bacterium]